MFWMKRQALNQGFVWQPSSWKLRTSFGALSIGTLQNLPPCFDMFEKHSQHYSVMFITTKHMSYQGTIFFIYSYLYIFTIIGYMTNSQLTTYPCGLVAQWIGHCTGIARSWVRIPVKPEFFSGCFLNCLSWKHTARITNFTHFHFHIYK